MKKNRRLYRALTLIMSITFFITIAGSVYADNSTGSTSFWKQASDWYKQGSTNTYLDDNILSDLANLVEIAGTGVIAIATVVIGMKYVLGSVTDKASAKENLITLLVACVFFFGWSNIRRVIIKGVVFTNSGAVNKLDGNSSLFLFGSDGSAENAFQTVFGIVLTIAQIVAILATVYLGVKYIFSGADGKAKLKEKGFGYIVGIIMVFATLNVLQFISNAITGAFS